MTKQLHKRFSTEEVKMLLEKYLTENVKLMYILEILKITQRRFFQLLKNYRKDPEDFSIEYKRKRPTRRISERNKRENREDFFFMPAWWRENSLGITIFSIPS